VVGLRCGQRPLCAARRVERQPGGPLQERGRRRETTAALCPACGLLKLGSNLLIRARRGLGTLALLAPARELAQIQLVGLPGQAPVPGQEPG
jgi:hypothetical protein